MQPDNWQRVRALFDALVDQPADTWVAALDEQGILDPDVRDDVLTLLNADRQDVVRTGIGA